MSEQQEPQPLAKPQLGTMETSIDNSSKVLQAWKVVVLADLNVDPPPETDGNGSSSVQLPDPDLTRLAIDESIQDKSTAMCMDNAVVEGEAKRVNKLGKCRSRYSKVDFSLDYGADADGDFPAQGVPLAREEKVSSLKTAVWHMRKQQISYSVLRQRSVVRNYFHWSKFTMLRSRNL